MDDEHLYRLFESRDPRFDGWFYRGVTSTRHLLPAELPGRAAEARQHALLPHGGGRPARRLPGLQALPARRVARVAGVERPRRRRRPGDAADRRRRRRPRGRRRASPAGSATASASSTRLLTAELGAGPLALARAQRAQTRGADRDDRRCRSPTSRSPPASPASASSTTRCARCSPQPPTELRGRVAHGAGASRQRASTCGCRTGRRSTSDDALRFLGVAGRPRRRGGRRRTYRRDAAPAARLGGRRRCAPGDGHVACRCTSTTSRDLAAAVARCRRLLDLDADPVAVDERSAPTRCSARWSRAGPGCACPGTVDGAELAVRAVLGQQVSVAGAAHARRPAGRRATATPLEHARRRRSRTCSRAPATLADAGPEHARDAASRRRDTLGALTRRAGRRRRSTSTPAPTAPTPARGCWPLPGIGPWTADVRRHARARRPRRLPADRPRRPPGARAARLPATAGAGRRRRALAPVARRTPSSTSGPASPTEHP